MSEHRSGLARMAVISGVISTVMAICGLIWSVATQNAKLNATTEAQQKTSITVSDHDKEIAVLKSQQQAYLEGQKEIKMTLKEINQKLDAHMNKDDK